MIEATSKTARAIKDNFLEPQKRGGNNNSASMTKPSATSKRQRRGNSPKNPKSGGRRNNASKRCTKSVDTLFPFYNASQKQQSTPNPQHQHPRSTKPYDKPMTKRDLYFAIDCEMVGVGLGGLRSALARVSVINWDGDVVFDTHVKVPEPVTDFRTFVSGIRAEDIESDRAMDPDRCRAIVSSLIFGKIIVGHGLQADLEVLGLSHPWCDVRDTAAYIPFMRVHKVGPEEEAKSMMFPRRLKELAQEKLGMEIQKEGAEHCPVEDALAALELYKSCRVEWEMLMIGRPTTPPGVAPAESSSAMPQTKPKAQVKSQPKPKSRSRKVYPSAAPCKFISSEGGERGFARSSFELHAM